MIKTLQNKWSVLLLLVITLLYTYPFFHKGYFSTDDGEWAVVRLTEMVRELRDYQFPPRWSYYLNHGYGYPLFLFTYPLPFYAGSIIRLFGLSYISIIKLLFVASVFLGTTGMYYFTRKYWHTYAALTCAVLYLVAPYKLINLYQRGSIGEVMVMAVVPWLLWAWDLWVGGKKPAGLIVTLLLTFTILSHNIGGLLFTAYFIAYIVFFLKKKNFLKNIYPVFQGLLLSSFFWLPALVEKKYIYLDKFTLADKAVHFASISELIMPITISSVKPTLFLGSMHLLAVLVAIYLFISGRFKNNIIIPLNIIIFILSIFMVLPVSRPIWNVGLLSSIDFPWRVLMISAFSMSILGGAATVFIKNNILKVIILFFILFLNIPFIATKNRFIRPDSYYETNDATTTSKDELTPIWVNEKPTNRPAVQVLSADGQIENIFQNSRSISFSGEFSKNEKIIINLLYYPGWSFWIDGVSTVIAPSPKTGLISMNIQRGWHKVEGKFLSTPIRYFADLLSLAGLLSIIFNIKLMKR